MSHKFNHHLEHIKIKCHVRHEHFKSKRTFKLPQGTWQKKLDKINEKIKKFKIDQNVNWIMTVNDETIDPSDVEQFEQILSITPPPLKIYIKWNLCNLVFAPLRQTQQLLFEGYMRTQILNDLSEDASIIYSNDVTNLCNTFYFLHIESLLKECRSELLQNEENNGMNGEEHIIDELCFKFMANKEYFPAFKIYQILIKHNIYELSPGVYHHGLAVVLDSWNKETIRDDDTAKITMEEYETAIELLPDNDGIRYDYARYLQDVGKYQ